MAPNFEAEFVFKHFCTLCATLCAGPLISQDLDRGAGSKRAHKGGGAQLYAPDTVFPGFRSWRRLRKGRHITKMMSEMRLPMRNPVRRAPFSQDLDRRAASKRAQKRGGCAQPYARDTVFPRFRSWRRLRKGHITKICFHMRLLRAGETWGERGGTRAGYKGKEGTGYGPRPTTSLEQ